MSEALTTTEAESFAKLEERVEAGLTNFIDVGNALSEIRDARLYRASHGTFEDYCRERWGMSRQRASQLVDAAFVMSTIVDKAAITTESQARELARVEPARRQEVVEKAVAATGGKITAAALREAARTELTVEKAEAPVGAGTDQPRKAQPIVFSEARDIWDTARRRLDNIRAKDPQRISVLNEVVQYAKARLDNNL